ncbi:hypothetical protein, partial [Micromonospora echinospora]|uniref:hypothetical protein n=1 Tax=Micromonospora echinospora TaxID=1877 RepID=UPI001B80C8EA
RSALRRLTGPYLHRALCRCAVSRSRPTAPQGGGPPEPDELPQRPITAEAIGERSALQRVLPALNDVSFDERFAFGVARMLAR